MAIEHTGVQVKNAEKAKRFYAEALKPLGYKLTMDFDKAALKAGGKDNGKPGLRKDYSPDYYAAFILDPDGNNIEAVCFKK